ncbi:uncharacterized protein LOC106642904 [Copidosoma floridanum]|uniref:uncharacterized protein LOC106642904 n=1 Tax=Copidosoma floridanum TaxID=29053 RepID=UPI0006C9471B|nr:uncharacterized protein LOC106642904 [Copidosoma floridanum]
MSTTIRGGMAGYSGGSGSTTGGEDLVYFELRGSYSITRPFYAEDLPEISRRSAVIMACHLLSQPQISDWDRLRPYVASYLHRAISSSSGVISFNSSLIQSFGDNAYVHNCPVYKASVKAPKNRNVRHEVHGSQELGVGAGISVHVKYNLAIFCSLDRTKGDLIDCTEAPEPHYSWWDLIKIADCASPGPTKVPFVVVVDKAICAEIKRNPLVCLTEK